LPATEVKAEEAPRAEGPQPEPKAVDNEGRGTPPNLFLKYAGIGASVAAGVVATLAVLWFATHLPAGGGANAIRDRLAAVEAQVGAKSNAPQADAQALTDLSQRLGTLEQAVAKVAATRQSDSTVTDRLTGVENSMRSLGIAVAELSKRTEDLATSESSVREAAEAARQAVLAQRERIGKLEQTAQATQEKAAQNNGADIAARRALAVFALRDAVLRNAPYATELASARNAGVEAGKLSPFERFAAAGIPTDATLAREMSALLPKLMEASGADAARSDSFIERLEANAGKLVRIHPVGEVAGDDPSAVLARLEVKAAHNDAAGIAIEIAKLPPKARDVVGAWSREFAARAAALAAVRDVARDAVAALAAR
jgi:hypothetical protein